MESCMSGTCKENLTRWDGGHKQEGVDVSAQTSTAVIIMTTYVLANWKANKTLSESVTWIETFLDLYEPQPHLKIIIAPPAIFLVPLKQVMDQRGAGSVSLAVQDLSPFPTGSYTGAVAADMVRDLVDYAIIGHSERRRHFHESLTEIANKITESQAAGITPILCLDKPYASAQLAALDQQNLDQDLLIGYGPVEVINLETPPPPEGQQEAIHDIHKMIPDHDILYGGSINQHNAQSYLELSGISGLMVGSACLDPEEFAKICRMCSGGI
jgi:triosephosphate isomerase